MVNIPLENWLAESYPIIIKTVISVLLIFSTIIVIVRVAGLRTFAKMSSYDFASTVAIGSILAAVVMSSDTETALLRGAVSMITIVAFQHLYAMMKRWSDDFQDLVENQPILLMDGTEILEDNLEKTGVSHGDLMAKLREANVIEFSEIKAVVMETTGDISVLHSSGDERADSRLLEGVKR